MRRAIAAWLDFQSQFASRRAVARGDNLFVLNQNSPVGQLANGTIGEYTTSGATVNAALITGLGAASDSFAVSGSDLFVTNQAGAPPRMAGEPGKFTPNSRG